MIEKLEYLIALAREKHFSRAAEACGVTQPTLSAGIKQLEEQLGVMLVRRGARFEGLTPDGERALEWARRIVGEARGLRAAMRASRRGPSGRIVIAVVPTALAATPDLLEPFAAENPEVEIVIRSLSSAEILAAIDDLIVDVGVSYLDDEPIGRRRAEPLYVERYALIARRGGALAGRDRIGWADLAGQPLALLTPDMQNRRIIERTFAGLGLAVEPRMQSDSMVALAAHVATGRYVSIMPLRLARMFGAEIETAPLDEPDVARTIGVLAPDREPLAPAVEALLRAARRIWRRAEPDPGPDPER